MRLAERTLLAVRLAPRAPRQGALGGMAEGFSDETVRLRASRIPESSALETTERGMKSKEKLRLLVPGDARASAGDGVWVEEKLYRIVTVLRWSAHLELVCEAIE